MKELEHTLNPVAPHAFVSYAKQKTIDQDVLSAQKIEQFETAEEFIYHITHHINNVLHDDGRIYMKIEKDGTLYANSVSPYSDTFFDNIEDKIKPLVKALHQKRYLTYSSCEGHGNSFRRYVGLAFADEESREYVAQYIYSLNIPGVRTRYSHSVANQTIHTHDNQKSSKIDYQAKFDPNSSEIDFNAYQAEIDTFNIQFHRKYDSYCFMELIILEEVPIGKNFWKNPFKNMWLCFMKKYYWDKLTQRLTNGINHSSFKKYCY